MRSLRCDRVTRGKVNYFISCETIANVRSIHTINAMDAASSELADLDALSNAELKALLQEKHAQLVVKNAVNSARTRSSSWSCWLRIWRQPLRTARAWWPNTAPQSPLRASPSRGASFPRISRAKRRPLHRSNHAAQTAAANSSIWAKTSARYSNASRCDTKSFALCDQNWPAHAAIPSCRRPHRRVRSNAAWPDQDSW